MDRPTLISDKWRASYAPERLAEFTARCRKRGLAITPQRVAVMRVLVNSGEHPRAETVFAQVRKEYPNISLATVHRTLETLCAIGEARKVTPLHDSARYDGNTAPHHHVVCVRCRKICDIDVPNSTSCSTGGIRWAISICWDARSKSRRCAGNAARGRRKKLYVNLNNRELMNWMGRRTSVAKSLKGTKTHENLKGAFAGESQANRRYLYFAKVADVEGQPEIAGLFRDTAEGETGHAHGHLDYLKSVGDPVTDQPIGDTLLNLKSAEHGETYEYTDMYPGMAKTAREEGFTEIADWFETLAKAEKSHAGRFAKAQSVL
jgi:rubrerythrin/Fe2+ or Zn2+ uptake regulation protein